MMRMRAVAESKWPIVSPLSFPRGRVGPYCALCKCCNEPIGIADRIAFEFGFMGLPTVIAGSANDVDRWEMFSERLKGCNDIVRRLEDHGEKRLFIG